MRMLSHDTILKLHAAIISAQLVASRTALLAGIDGNFVAGLSHAASPSDQILEDLDAMNRTGLLADGNVPLATWLRNAIARAAGKKEAAVFRDALAHCYAAMPQPTRDGALRHAEGLSASPRMGELDELSQARLRAETAVLPFILQHGIGFSPGDNMPVIGCVVENHGEKPFRITEARATWRFAGVNTENFAETRIFQHRVDPGGQATVNAILSMNPAERAEFDARLGRDPYLSPAEVSMTVCCQNAAGYGREERQTVRWPVPPRPAPPLASGNTAASVRQSSTPRPKKSSGGTSAHVVPDPALVGNLFEPRAKRAVHRWLTRKASASQVTIREEFPDFCVTNCDGTFAWVDILCFPSETASAVRRLREKLGAIVEFAQPQTAFAGFCLLTVASSHVRARSVKSMFGRLRQDTFCGLVCISGYLDSRGQFECEDDGGMNFLFHVSS